MELEKFVRKCRKCKISEERVYFLIFDRYHYYECYNTYDNIKNIVKELINAKRSTYINSDEACVQETEFYLTHLNNIYKLKQMGYTSITF